MESYCMNHFLIKSPQSQQISSHFCVIDADNLPLYTVEKLRFFVGFGQAVQKGIGKVRAKYQLSNVM